MQTRMRAEDERGLAIQNTGEAIASRAIRGQCISFSAAPGRSPREGEEISGSGLSHVYCSEEIGDAVRENLPPSTYYSTRREELRCRRPRERNEEMTCRTCSQRRKKRKKERKRDADDNCIF